MALPERSTPYFSLSENVEIYELQARERTPRNLNSGRIVEESSGRIVEQSSGRIVEQSSGRVIEDTNSICLHSLPVIRGYIRGCFGDDIVRMDFCNPYSATELNKWTKSIKLKIWKAAQSEWTTVDGLNRQLAIGNGTIAPVLNADTFFNKNNLVLSWMDLPSLDRVGELSPKVNLIFNFGPDDRLFQWEEWAREKNVVIINQSIKHGQNDSEDRRRRAFHTTCKDTINSLNNFLRLQHCCPICKETRLIHAVFVCDGTSKSLGALLASMMFFGHCDLNSVFSSLLKKKSWHPLPLVDHTFVLEALLHMQQCILAEIGK